MNAVWINQKLARFAAFSKLPGRSGTRFEGNFSGVRAGRVSQAWAGKRQSERERAKVKLKKAGFTNRSAAPCLGVTYQHLSAVLNGHRKSLRLLAKIQGLPEEVGK